jgi:outer membrane biosynthesis protein TonB
MIVLSGCNQQPPKKVIIKKPIVIQKRLFIQTAPKVEEKKAKSEAKEAKKEPKAEKKEVAKPEAKKAVNKFAVNQPMVAEKKEEPKACCGKKKNKELVLYKNRYQAVAQCTRDVETVVQSNDCDTCGAFEVTVRKNSCCAKNTCDRAKDRK